ncbi:nucleotide exchange factor GrpE [Frankia sp. QA3]|uniref:nucleotide exchange factor GrpE n=1 Tax=Frankia sp. QA3 TaxID=710111 RepID=UPI0009FDB060|nr:nucleotide exchange factor GrpE [Frankia sp. QA3]
MAENRPDAERPDAAAASDLAAQLEQCQAAHLRTLADFDNVRRRTGREIAAAKAAERDRVVRAWLPVLDHLELALAHAESHPDALADGVRGVRQLALEALRAGGVSRIDADSGPFDPNRHEVGAVVDGSAQPEPIPAGTVIEVMRPGYQADGRVLRPASVAVSAGPRPQPASGGPPAATPQAAGSGGSGGSGPQAARSGRDAGGPGPDAGPEAS